MAELFMLSVIILNVVILSVVAPKQRAEDISADSYVHWL
jgi:hypothetical protein